MKDSRQELSRAGDFFRQTSVGKIIAAQFRRTSLKFFSYGSLLVTMCWFATAMTAAADSTNPPVTEPSRPAVNITRLQVDGKWRDIDASMLSGENAALRLPSGVHALNFQFGPTLESDENCLRLRYQLEGLDQRWRESGSPGMRLVVRFQNAANDFLDEYGFYVLGDSDGWRGSISNSALTARSERMVVPEGAVNMAIFVISGGSVEALGILAIDDLTVSVVKPQSDRKEFWLKDGFEDGKDLDLVTGTPLGWVRGGLRRDILQVLQYGTPPTNHALAAVDTHVRSFGEWFRVLPMGGHAKPGDTIVLEWKQVYSIGYGKTGKALYEVVPPGQYIFRVAGFSTPEGKPIAAIALPIYVPPPFWGTLWFILSSWSIGAIVVAVAVRYFTRRRMRLQMERLEWQQSLERERARIARDIHDDLGAGLTRISMLSVAAYGPANPAVKPRKELDEIIQTAHDLVGAMDEIVWAVNPKHDKLDSLIAYCGKYAQDFFKNMAIRCRLDLAFDVPDWTLTSQTRHNLFLALKEALNNSARHAQAQTVVVSAKMDGDIFILAVHDDGNGFDPAQVQAGGNGLANMQHRLDEIGGQCRIESALGKGTTVKFIFKKQL